jgi:hypothetical protein
LEVVMGEPMDLAIWAPAEAPSAAEMQLLRLCKKQKIWVFLRNHRHLLVPDTIRAELAAMYVSGSRKAGSPVCPERMLLAMLLQVLTGASDAEVPTLTAVDRRWQMVLDMLGSDAPLMSQGAVFKFRERVRLSGLMGRLLEHTVCVAREEGGYSAKRVRALIDSSPLTGAGRVEDTFNLLGRCIAMLVEEASEHAGQSVEDVAAQLDLSVVGGSSVKAALDCDWPKPEARNLAIRELLAQLHRVRQWLQERLPEEALATPPIAETLALVERVVDQDTEPDPDAPRPGHDGPPAEDGPAPRRLHQGVRKDRIVSVSDPDMRIGHKTRTRSFAGYKRNILSDLVVPGLVLAVEVQPANRPDADAAAPLLGRVAQAGLEVDEIHVDRAYLASDAVHELRAAGVDLVCKAPTVPRGANFNRYDFDVDYEANTLTCPAGETVPLRGDGQVHRFPTPTCRACLVRDHCVTERNRYGRTVPLHPHEKLYRDSRAEMATSEGRAKRRQRVQVEHDLARIGQIQGTRARYRGLEKNQFDLTRTAVLANCYVIDGLIRKVPA